MPSQVLSTHHVHVGYSIMHDFSVPLSFRHLCFRNITCFYNSPWDKILSLKPIKHFSTANLWLPCLNLREFMHHLKTRTYFLCVYIKRTKKSTLKSVRKSSWFPFYIYTCRWPPGPRDIVPIHGITNARSSAAQWLCTLIMLSESQFPHLWNGYYIHKKKKNSKWVQVHKQLAQSLIHNREWRNGRNDEDTGRSVCLFIPQLSKLIVCLLMLCASAGVTRENPTDKASVLRECAHGRAASYPIASQSRRVSSSVSPMEASAAMPCHLLHSYLVSVC